MIYSHCANHLINIRSQGYRSQSVALFVIRDQQRVLRRSRSSPAMNRSVPLILLGLWALSSADPVDEVKTVLSKVNIQMSRRFLGEVAFGEHRFRIPVLLDVGVKRSSVGKLTTFVVRREVDQHIRQHSDDDGTTHYDFDVSVGLEDLHVRFNVFFSYLSIFSTSPTINIEAHTNTIQLKGTLTQLPNGTCTSELTAASFTELSDFDLSILPHGLINNLLGFFGDLINNYIIDSHLYSLTDKFLQKSIKDPRFKQNFSVVLCESLVQ